MARRHVARAGPAAAGYGPLYGVMFVLLLAAATGGLAARYRKAGVLQ